MRSRVLPARACRPPIHRASGPGARRARRLTPRTASSSPALVIEQARNGCRFPLKRRQTSVQAWIIGRPQPRDASLRQAGKSRRYAWVRGRSAGRHEFGHHRAAVRDENVLAGLHRANDFTQTILELADTHRLHVSNVATCSHFVKRRPTAWSRLRWPTTDVDDSTPFRSERLEETERRRISKRSGILPGPRICRNGKKSH